MKLVDLLVREFTEWPNRCLSLRQDKDDWLLCENNFIYCQLEDRASDYQTAIVTREQWQAARIREDDISD